PVLSPRTRLALEIAAAGVAGGIIGDALLRAMPWGLNVALGTTVLVGMGAWLVRRHHIKPGPDAAWLAITALLLGLAFLRRDAEMLTAFDAIALVGALALAAATLQGEVIAQWYPLDLARGVITARAASIVVVVQLRYCFGGAALVEETSGLTYAEYARRGFFELMTASGLMLPILLGADELVRKGAAPQIRVVRQLSGLLLAFLAVIMVSALQRMRLYVAAFGLSEQRLYATAFM